MSIFSRQTLTPMEYLVQHIFGEQDQRLGHEHLDEKCHAFGHPEYLNRVSASHPTAYTLAAALSRDGFIKAESSCSWCVEETRFDALKAYLESAFGPDGVVMERQNDFCRFKVRGPPTAVQDVRLGGKCQDPDAHSEYSVSQMTLEQIFNSFASQQEEEP
ncbi:unnamed protein product [Phytophthora lilii]|uniref:Unnamed protein product n=1 Tax=Phytophthora lilii TaxID=2077276 RepID=A0A9W6TAY8_9STRA|nr:unnamed protein product [Phytophthora lilii]